MGNQKKLKAFDSAWADGAKRNSCDLRGETFWKTWFVVLLRVLDLKSRTVSCSAPAVHTGVFESSLRIGAVRKADPEIVRSRLPGQGL